MGIIEAAKLTADTLCFASECAVRRFCASDVYFYSLEIKTPQNAIYSKKRLQHTICCEKFLCKSCTCGRCMQKLPKTKTTAYTTTYTYT